MTNYFDPKIIGRIKNLDLRSMRLVENFNSGMHKSKILGISTEFAQHRQYVEGDEIKHIDWKVFAKTDKYYIKQYEAETSMTTYFLIDTSASMFFKSDEAAMSKFDYAATTVSAMMYMIQGQKDTFALGLFDGKVHTRLPAKGSKSHYQNCNRLLEAAKPSTNTNVAASLSSIAPQVPQAGIVILISDFIADLDKFALALGQMNFIGHDLIIFHVEDPLERDFSYGGQTIFIGPENEGKLLCDPRDLRSAYLKEREDHIGEVRRICRRAGYELENMFTDTPLDATLSGIIANRAARKMSR